MRFAIFKLNTEEFPDSWNAFDSYAEGLMRNGQKELAIKNYKHSLELNSGNTNAIQQIKVLQPDKDSIKTNNNNQEKITNNFINIFKNGK